MSSRGRIVPALQTSDVTVLAVTGSALRCSPPWPPNPKSLKAIAPRGQTLWEHLRAPVVRRQSTNCQWSRRCLMQPRIRTSKPVAARGTPLATSSPSSGGRPCDFRHPHLRRGPVAHLPWRKLYYAIAGVEPHGVSRATVHQRALDLPRHLCVHGCLGLLGERHGLVGPGAATGCSDRDPSPHPRNLAGPETGSAGPH